MVAGASQVVKASTREWSVQGYRDVALLQNLTGPNQGATEVASFETLQENNSQDIYAGHRLTACYQEQRSRWRKTRG